MKNYISDFNEACTKLGRSNQLPDFSGFAEHKRPREIATYQLEAIIEVNNGDWKAKTSDTSQRKYYPWFWVHADESRPSGFRLSYSSYVFVNDGSALGARLACKDEELAEFMGGNCTELYELAHA